MCKCLEQIQQAETELGEGRYTFLLVTFVEGVSGGAMLFIEVEEKCIKIMDWAADILKTR